MPGEIGTGTANLSVNVPTDERLAIVRAAIAMRAESMGDLLRHLILRGAEAEFPELAAQIRAVRKKYYGRVKIAAISTGRNLRRREGAGSALLLVLFVSLLLAGPDMPMRRPTRRARQDVVEGVG